MKFYSTAMYHQIVIDLINELLCSCYVQTTDIIWFLFIIFCMDNKQIKPFILNDISSIVDKLEWQIYQGT